jgi:hypothetical protein
MTRPRQALRADELVADAHGLVQTPEGVSGPITRITRPFPRYRGSRLEIHVVGGQSVRRRPWELFYLPDDEGDKEVEATVVEAPPPVEAPISVPVLEAQSPPAGVSLEASPLPVEVEARVTEVPSEAEAPGDAVDAPGIFRTGSSPSLAVCNGARRAPLRDLARAGVRGVDLPHRGQRRRPRPAAPRGGHPRGPRGGHGRPRWPAPAGSARRR